MVIRQIAKFNSSPKFLLIRYVSVCVMCMFLFYVYASVVTRVYVSVYTYLCHCVCIPKCMHVYASFLI